MPKNRKHSRIENIFWRQFSQQYDIVGIQKRGPAIDSLSKGIEALQKDIHSNVGPVADKLNEALFDPAEAVSKVLQTVFALVKAIAQLLGTITGL